MFFVKIFFSSLMFSMWVTHSKIHEKNMNITLNMNLYTNVRLKYSDINHLV